MYINSITGFNGNYNNSIQPQERNFTNITSRGMNAANNYNIDKNEQKILEEIKKEIIKKTKHRGYLYDALSFAYTKLKKNGLGNKYYYHHYTKEKYSKSVQKIFDELDLNICEKVIDKFEVYDRYNGRPTTVFLYKKPNECPIDYSIQFGEKEVPVENIELAYKDIEKIAKAGYVDRNFIDSIKFSNTNNNDSIPDWPKLSWQISPSGTLCSYWAHFRKFGMSYHIENLSAVIQDLENKLKQTNDPEKRKEINDEIKYLHKEERVYPEELKPGFVDKYLKAWKEEMLKVNKLGIDRYRYEKYGRTH